LEFGKEIFMKFFKKLLTIFLEYYWVILGIACMAEALKQNKKSIACIFLLILVIGYLFKKINDLEIEVEMIKIDMKYYKERE
jgi:hypothetical protein